MEPVSAGMAALGFARAHWKLGVLIVLALFASIQTVRLGHAQNVAERAKQNLAECRQGRIDDRKAYEDAQRKAAELNKAQVNRIVSEQEKINAEAKSRYQRDLERLRSGGLRKDIAAPQGSAGCANPGAVPQAAAGADEQNLCVPRSLLVRAAEIELGRNALIDWINEQLKVER